MTINKVLLGFVALLGDTEPNSCDCLERSISEVFKKDHAKFIETAIEWKYKYAMI